MNKLTFKTIKFKNLMSYGNSWTTFDFTNGMTLITGLNGEGKTASMVALFYALYGKTFKKTKLSSLINDVNAKDMSVELEFSINTDVYKIIRGQKPNVFEIYENDKLIDQNSSVAEYQDYLETYILKVPENAFRQLIFLGANVVGAKSFVELTKAEKEELFQLITDTSLFKVIKDSIKERTQSYKTISTELKYKIDVLIETLKTEKANIIQMEEQNSKVKTISTDRRQAIDSRLIEITEKQDKIKDGLKKLKDIKTRYDENSLKLEEINKSISNYNKEYQLVSNQVSKIDSAKEAFKLCIGCDKLKAISNIDLTNESALRQSMKRLDICIIDESTKLEDLNIKVQQDRDKLDKGKVGKQQYDLLADEKSRLESELSSISTQELIEIDYSSVTTKEQEIETLKLDFTNTSLELSKLKTLDGLLSNDNLKGVIINQTLPILNKYINEYIQKFSDFDFNFYIDSNFKENVVLRARDREFHSLSNGQGFRITFSILFAFLKIVEERNGISTNLLILDEILDSSLDSNGRNELIHILKSDFADIKNVIVVSHNTDILSNEVFDRRFLVKKEGHFSKINAV
jgi:DNA repair exonuclease SbcCD ATPase subunit